MGQKSRQKKAKVASQKPLQASAERPAARASILSGGGPELASRPAPSYNPKAQITDHMDYVRSDIVRIILLLVVALLLLVILDLLNLKTPLLHVAGQKLSAFLRL